MTTKPPGFIQRSLDLWDTLTGGLDLLQPLAAWRARLYLAQAFFMSGLTKLRDWEPPSRFLPTNTTCPCCRRRSLPRLERRVSCCCRCCWYSDLAVAYLRWGWVW